MKKRNTYLLVLILFAMFLISACSQADTQSSDSASPSENANGESSDTDLGSNKDSEQAVDNKTLDTSIQFLPASDLSKLPTAAQNRNDTVIFGLVEPSGAFTPYFHQSGYDGNVASVLYTPLVTVDREGLPIPQLAERWEISEDQLTYTFFLHEGLKFSDGSPLTAEDVEFTLTLLHDKGYDGSTDIFMTPIVGGLDYKEGRATKVEGIKVIDPLTIEITLTEVNATALLTLGGYVLSKEYYGKDYEFGNLQYIRELHANPVGNGPYKLERHLPGQEIRFVANEHFYQGKPEIERFIYKTTEGDTFQFLETGEQDYASFSATADHLEKLERLGFVNRQINTSSAYGFIQFNHNKPHFKDKKVRQALAYGLDRKTIVEGVSQGSASVANIPVSPISWAYTEEGINPYEYDPEKAKELLDEAGWIEGADGIREKDGQKLVIHYVTSKSTNSDAFIVVAKENFEAIGIKFEPEQFADFNAMNAKVDSGDYDLASYSTPMLIDPSNGVLRFATGNLEGYSNPTVDQLIKEGVSTTDIEERKEAYKKLYQELNEDLPYIFYSYSKLVFASNGRIQGLEVSPYRGIATSLPNLKLE